MISLNLRVLLSIGMVVAPPLFPTVPIAEELLPDSLRDYQFDMLAEAADLMRQGYRRILLQLPTGAGKTVMASAALASAARQEMAGQFIVHRKELIDQTSLTFAAGGLPHGFVAAGRPFDPAARVTLAGVQTLANRLDIVMPPNLAVIDEAHHATASTWQRVLDAYPDAFVLGLTATPQRLDGRGLDDHFDVMIAGPSVAELIERGFLSPFSYYAPGIPDLTGVGTTAGDFNRGGLAEAMDKPHLVGDVVEHYQRLASGQQGIVFAASRDHSRHIAEAFGAAGFRAAHVDGSMSDREREAAVKAFRAGDLHIMSNVELFGEGFDVPGIVYVGLARPTKSIALHLQQVGRSLRVIPGKTEAIICDHAGNAFRHGLPDDEREWSLEGRAAQQRAAGASDADPVRQCLVCYRVSPSTVQTCPGCGTEFPKQDRRLQQVEGQLSKLDRDLLKRRKTARRKAEEQACKFEEDFVRLAIARGYNEPEKWAKLRVKTRLNASRRWGR